MVVSRRRVQSHKPVRYVLNTLRIQIVYYLYTGCNKNIRSYYRFPVRNVRGQSNKCIANIFLHMEKYYYCLMSGTCTFPSRYLHETIFF